MQFWYSARRVTVWRPVMAKDPQTAIEEASKLADKILGTDDDREEVSSDTPADEHARLKALADARGVTVEEYLRAMEIVGGLPQAPIG